MGIRIERKPQMLVVIILASILAMGGCASPTQSSSAGSDTTTAVPQKLSSEQLQSLLSPIALYPDSLVSLMLLASTYPLEVAEAYNWRTSNASLQGSNLQNALAAQSWNDSVKSLISFPQSLTMMGKQLQWTQNLDLFHLI
jgi:hypothetical protein